MNRYEQQLMTALDALRLKNTKSYTWFGKKGSQLGALARRNLAEHGELLYLKYNLQNNLYQDFYCKGLALPEVKPTLGAVGAQDASTFIKQLEDANSGRGYLEGGWKIVGEEKDSYVVHKDALCVRAPKDDCVFEAHADGSDYVRLPLPSSLQWVSPGFYMTLGDTPFNENKANLRIYWNLTSGGAIHLVGAVTTRLNEAKVPYHLKVLNDPRAYDRCDAGVLYIRSQDYPDIELDRLYELIRENLKPRVPAFTKPLAPGLALAEDPGDGQSFGMHRCFLMAEGITSALGDGERNAEFQLKSILSRFSDEGISIERPYINGGSQDRYEIHINTPAEHMLTGFKIPPDDAPNGRAKSAQSDPIGIADQIGRRIVENAVVSGNMCSWIGATLINVSDVRTVGYKSLGPDLYAGTAGVSLFLAELCIATGSAEYRDLAAKSARCALANADQIPPQNRLGLYLGWVGIAYVAAYVGLLLGEEALIASSRKLLRRCRQTDDAAYNLDLLEGIAGAVAGLVTLHRIFPEDGLLEFATDLGDRLVSKANVEHDGTCSWPSPQDPNQLNLLGFSHGTSGIAYALTELHSKTGLQIYQTAASGSRQYESNWFQPSQRNWPDFRGFTKSTLGRSGRIPTPPFWCHGAPGIALARLRAVRLGAAEADIVDVPLNRTVEILEDWLSDGAEDFCMCHGLAGNADILLHASRHPSHGADGALRSIVDKVAMVGQERHVEGKKPWCCGIGAGETPALMLGLAGIGLFYLRSEFAYIPSILILEPEIVHQRFQNEIVV